MFLPPPPAPSRMQVLLPGHCLSESRYAAWMTMHCAHLFSPVPLSLPCPVLSNPNPNPMPCCSGWVIRTGQVRQRCPPGLSFVTGTPLHCHGNNNNKQRERQRAQGQAWQQMSWLELSACQGLNGQLGQGTGRQVKSTSPGQPQSSSAQRLLRSCRSPAVCHCHHRLGGRSGSPNPLPGLFLFNKSCSVRGGMGNGVFCPPWGL